jgi:hypothetical protein
VGLHKHGYPSFCHHSFYELLLQWTTYIHNKYFYEIREIHMYQTVGVQQAITTHLYLTPSRSVHVPRSNHTKSSVLLMLTFYP